MRSMGGCSKAEKNGSSIRKMAFLRKIPFCHHDSRKYRGCDADRLIQNSRQRLAAGMGMILQVEFKPATSAH